MPARVIVANALIALVVAAVVGVILRVRYMSPKNVRQRERDRRGY